MDERSTRQDSRKLSTLLRCLRIALTPVENVLTPSSSNCQNHDMAANAAFHVLDSVRNDTSLEVVCSPPDTVRTRSA